MVGSYWKSVAKRAWRRGLEMVRMESFERVVVFLIGLLIPAVAVWYFVGDTAGATVRALAALGGSAIGAVLIFGWNLVRLPAVMAAEAEVERQRIAEQLESEEARRRKCDALGEFIARGSALRRQCAVPDGLIPDLQSQEWLDELVDYLETNLGPAYAARVHETAAVPMGMTSLDWQRSAIDGGLRTRLFHLEQFCRELA
jgi:hypothetical protein